MCSVRSPNTTRQGETAAGLTPLRILWKFFSDHSSRMEKDFDVILSDEVRETLREEQKMGAVNTTLFDEIMYNNGIRTWTLCGQRGIPQTDEHPVL